MWYQQCVVELFSIRNRLVFWVFLQRGAEFGRVFVLVAREQIESLTVHCTEIFLAANGAKWLNPESITEQWGLQIKLNVIWEKCTKIMRKLGFLVINFFTSAFLHRSPHLSVLPLEFWMEVQFDKRRNCDWMLSLFDTENVTKKKIVIDVKIYKKKRLRITTCRSDLDRAWKSLLWEAEVSNVKLL